jgi:hypothetical protein
VKRHGDHGVDERRHVAASRSVAAAPAVPEELAGMERGSWIAHSPDTTNSLLLLPP